MQISLRIATWNGHWLPIHIAEVAIFVHQKFIDFLPISQTHFINRFHFKFNGYKLITANRSDNITHADSASVMKSTIGYKLCMSSENQFCKLTYKFG